jgi:hypothetical protein
MRKILGVCLLVLLLTNTAVAGEMQNGSPTPPPSSAPQEGYSPSESPTSSQSLSGVDTTADDADAAASLTQIALDLLAVWPALL